MTDQKKRQRIKRDLPERIPDTPDNIARSIMKRRPKKTWRYLQEHEQKKSA